MKLLTAIIPTVPRLLGAGLYLENNIVQRIGQKEKSSFLRKDLYNDLQRLVRKKFQVQFLVKNNNNSVKSGKNAKRSERKLKLKDLTQLWLN